MLDRVLNVTLGLVLCLSILVYTFPIFGHTLYAPGSTYNFGTMNTKDKVRHTFTLRNLHPWTVTVTGINSDCGCTQSVVGKTIPFQLAPFEAVDVTSTLNLYGKAGFVTQNIHVITDPNNKSALLTLKGRVR